MVRDHYPEDLGHGPVNQEEEEMGISGRGNSGGGVRGGQSWSKFSDLEEQRGSLWGWS